MLRILYGPTAGGKSALALEWAKDHRGVIVNADALQVYGALPILTAQPSEEDKGQTPHELYGFADPRESMNAAKWAQLAANEIAKADNVILVGGTGMYIATLLDGIAPIPDVPPETRMRLSERYDAQGPDAFHEELHAIDPRSAKTIHPNRREQMIRAYEVYEATGVPFSEWRDKPKQRFLPKDALYHLIAFLPDKKILMDRATARFETMLERNMIKEVEGFAELYGEAVPAAKALGFKALLAHARKEITLDEARARVLQDTADYIKRQLTWGRQQFGKRDHAVICSDAESAVKALA